ncbi:MAG: hypothetical protein Q9181_000274 [Wetmoreana brouardii]
MESFQNDFDGPDFWGMTNDSSTFNDSLLEDGFFANDFALFESPLNEVQTAETGLTIQNEGQDAGALAADAITMPSNHLNGMYYKLQHQQQVLSTNLVQAPPNDFSTDQVTYDDDGLPVFDEVDFVRRLAEYNAAAPWPASAAGASQLPPANVAVDAATSQSHVIPESSTGQDSLAPQPKVNQHVDSRVTTDTSGNAVSTAPPSLPTHHNPSNDNNYNNCLATSHHSGNNTPNVATTTMNRQTIGSIILGAAPAGTIPAMASSNFTVYPTVNSAAPNGHPSNSLSPHTSPGSRQSRAQSQHSVLWADESSSPKARVYIQRSSSSPQANQNVLVPTLPGTTSPPGTNRPQTTLHGGFRDEGVYQMSFLIQRGLAASDVNESTNDLQAGLTHFLNAIRSRMHHNGVINRVAMFIDNFSLDEPREGHLPQDVAFHRLADAFDKIKKKFADVKLVNNGANAALRQARDEVANVNAQRQQAQNEVASTKTQLQNVQGEANELRSKLQATEHKHDSVKAQAEQALAKQRTEIERLRAERSHYRHIATAQATPNQDQLQQCGYYINALHHAHQTIAENAKQIAVQQQKIANYETSLHFFGAFNAQRAPQPLSNQDLISRFHGQPNIHAGNITTSVHTFHQAARPSATSAGTISTNEHGSLQAAGPSATFAGNIDSNANGFFQASEASTNPAGNMDTNVNGFLPAIAPAANSAGQPQMQVAAAPVQRTTSTAIDLTNDASLTIPQPNEHTTQTHQDQLSSNPPAVYQTPPPTRRCSDNDSPRNGLAAHSNGSGSSPRRMPSWVQTTNAQISGVGNLSHMNSTPAVVSSNASNNHNTGDKRPRQEPVHGISPNAEASRPAKKAKASTSPKRNIKEKKPAKKPAPKLPKEKAKKLSKKDKEMLTDFSYEEYMEQMTLTKQPIESKEEFMAWKKGAKTAQTTAPAKTVCPTETITISSPSQQADQEETEEDVDLEAALAAAMEEIEAEDQQAEHHQTNAATDAEINALFEESEELEEE